MQNLRAGDMLVLTADHGNDPTWVGTDHTRERVPVLVDGIGPGTLGLIGFRDVAKLVAGHLTWLCRIRATGELNTHAGALAIAPFHGTSEGTARRLPPCHR